MHKNNIFLLPISSFILINTLIFPKEIISASSFGLLLWFNNLLPCIFPFVVTINIITSTGGDIIIGKIFNPIIKKIFNVSYHAGTPFLLGFLSGYPLGTKIISDLYSNKNISTDECQRIMSFSNHPSLIFVIGTIGANMLNNPVLGYILIFSTFTSSILSGIIFSFYKKNTPIPKYKYTSTRKSHSLGEILNNSVSSSISTVTMIGGFIIFFSVLSKSLELWGIFDMISNGLCIVTGNLLPKEYFSAVLKGILEMTGGIQALSTLDLPITTILPTISALLYFGGFSILAQTTSIISHTGIKVHLYVISRIIGGVSSYLMCMVLISLTDISSSNIVPVFSVTDAHFFDNLKISILASVVIIILLLKLSSNKKHYSK